MSCDKKCYYSKFQSLFNMYCFVSILDEETLPNTAILVGPNGVGKTASVYALAHEMGFKVLEVNASSSRNGRQVLTNLREATQSHDVRKKAESHFLLQNKQQQKQSQKDGGQKQPQQVERTALILFEDIDLIFGESDEGFYSAVNTLIATTKRPIILTTSKSSFLDMQDSAKSKVLKLLPQAFTFSPVEAEAAARHLQLMALVEGFSIDLNSLLTFNHLHDGNVSQAILDLQCLLTSCSPIHLDTAQETITTKERDDCNAYFHSHEKEDDEDVETKKIVKLMGLDLPISNCIYDNNLYDLSGLVTRQLHLPSIFEWEHSTNMLLSTSHCCKEKVEDGDADLASSSSLTVLPQQTALSSAANNSATITKPLENGGRRINLHSGGCCFFAQKEQKTKSWQKTASSSSGLGDLKNSGGDCFRKNKQMLNHLSLRAEVASLFWPRLCTYCQHGACHKWRRTALSCPDSAASEAMIEHWGDPVCNDLVASYIHGGSTQGPLNTKDLQMASSSSASIEAAARDKDKNEHIVEAYHDAMYGATNGSSPESSSMNRKMAFMDVLPVMRSMLRSEAARKDTIMEVKRSRSAGRFLHYFDSINLCLNEATLEALKRPFQ